MPLACPRLAAVRSTPLQCEAGTGVQRFTAARSRTLAEGRIAAATKVRLKPDTTYDKSQLPRHGEILFPIWPRCLSVSVFRDHASRPVSASSSDQHFGPSVFFHSA